MEITKEMALCYAKEFELDFEVQKEMNSGLTPEQALYEWDCVPTLYEIDFGIDTDPWTMTEKYNFKEWLSKFLGREMPWNSCFFGCAEWNRVKVTKKQHETIAKELYEYYKNDRCRGVACTDFKKILGL